MTTPPYVGAPSPATIDSTVDLPQPEWPRMQTNSLCRMTALTSFTATNGPDGVSKIFVRPAISSGAIMRPASSRRASGRASATR
jgi:hypothetical protein